MRATRAYIAGFGTAGSLLAGAALVFVLASAVVSFKGWPQLTAQAQSAAIVQLKQPAGSDPAARRVLAIVAALPAPRTARGPATAAAPSPAATQPTARTHRTATGQGQVSLNHPAHTIKRRPARTGTPTLTTPSPTTGVDTSSCTSGNCVAHAVGSALGTVTSDATGKLGKTTSQAGNGLGKAVSGVTGALGAKLSQASRGLGGTVTSVGQGLGTSISTASGTVGGTLTNVGKTVSGLLSGLGGSGQ